MFVSGRLIQPSLMFEDEAKYLTPRVGHLKDSSLRLVTASLTIIILSWKNLTRTNTLAYLVKT
jgi:hypothetical protein